VVKVPLAMLFFAALEENGISEADLPAYLQSTGVGGRTFDQLLRAMLVVSEEKATAILEDYTRSTLNLPAQQRAWGWEHLDLEARRDTAAGVADIFAQLYRGEHISPTARALILGYLSEYTPNDDTRIGVLRPQLPPGAQIYNKRGSLLTPYVVADVAIIENPSGTDYLLVIFAYNGEPKTTYERLDAAVAEIAQAFWDSVAAP
jgi:beta-lactamase class A